MMTSLASEVLARHHSVHDYGDRWFCPGCDGLRPETGCDAARVATALAAAQATLDTVAAARDALRAAAEHIVKRADLYAYRHEQRHPKSEDGKRYGYCGDCALEIDAAPLRAALAAASPAEDPNADNPDGWNVMGFEPHTAATSPAEKAT